MDTKRAIQRKFHIIYKTTCIITGKWYIGMHSTDNLDDEYLGSGQILWKSIKKYGRENHMLEILEFLPNRKTLSDRETEILSEDLRNDPKCMNIRPGGTGKYPGKPSSEETIRKLKQSLTGRQLSPSHIESMKRERKKRYQDPTERQKVGRPGRQKSQEHKTKIGKANKGKKRTIEQKAKMSVDRRGKPNPKCRKRCTVDGIIIYESRKDLVKALGQGKNGFNHPNFIYLD